jgi:hypothetical protein
MTNTAAPTATLTYRKSRSEWVVYGPATALKANTMVTVTKRSGETKQEYIETVGKRFTVDGTAMRYGYIGVSPAQWQTDAERADAAFAAMLAANAAEAATATTAPRRNAKTCDECGATAHTLHPAVDSSGIPGHCCGRCATQPSYALSFC